MGGAGANVGSVITAITSSVTKCEIGKVKGSKTGSSRNGITDSSKNSDTVYEGPDCSA
jgi:hypothetical protein